MLPSAASRVRGNCRCRLAQSDPLTRRAAASRRRVDLFPTGRGKKKPTLRTPEFRDFRQVLLSFPLLPNGERERSADRRTFNLCSPCEGEPCAPCEGALANRRSTAVFYSRRAVLPNRTRAFHAPLIQAECYVRPSARPVQPRLHGNGSFLAEADGPPVAPVSPGLVRPGLLVTAPRSAA
jgi:hypothetical protein